jgi:hypothetical protein
MLTSSLQVASRRRFLQQSFGLGVAAFVAGPMSNGLIRAAETSDDKLKLGLCTFQWGQDWELPTLIANCEKAEILGVELRTMNRHGVEPNLGKAKRAEVKKRFAGSRVTFVGLGTNECFDSVDSARVNRSLESAKAFLQLSHDCGGSGIKVKPNDFHKEVAHEKTIEQIGRSLNALGKTAADLGQQLRLEVHGTCLDLPVIKQIMDVADHPSVAVCWNCNPHGDLVGQGLEYNFNLVKDRLGATLHVHELEAKYYPYEKLFDLLTKANHSGWILLECSSKPADRVAAMIQQRKMFNQLVQRSRNQG